MQEGAGLVKSKSVALQGLLLELCPVGPWARVRVDEGRKRNVRSCLGVGGGASERNLLLLNRRRQRKEE